MMYRAKLAASIKVAGKVLREFGDEVRIPFGSEYSIFIKNLNTSRAMVKVSVDGVDVLNGSELVVEPNSSIELERFLKDLRKGNRFRLIERTSEIEKNRGIGVEDGLVRIEFAFEVERKDELKLTNPWSGYYLKSILVQYIEPKWFHSTDPNLYKSFSTTHHPPNAFVNCSHVVSRSADAGITVPGSISEQSFTTTSWFETGSSEVIVLKLIGDTGQSLVKQAVTVKFKPKCITCGRQNKATSKFCTNCGTSLEVI